MERDSVIALARSANVFVVGVSDSHGWGATSMVWNLVRLRDPLSKSADVCAAVLHRLSGGFPAVQVVERHRLRPDAWWPALADADRCSLGKLAKHAIRGDCGLAGVDLGGSCDQLGRAEPPGSAPEASPGSTVDQGSRDAS